MSATDAASFERLVRDQHAAVFRICRGILRDEHLGADAAQDAFLRLWRHRGRIPAAGWAAWLRKAAVSAAIDLRRRAALRRTAPFTVAEDVGAPAGPAEPDLVAHLERALRLLSASQRTVFLLRHRGGLPLAEIAVVLELAPSTVKTHFARACIKIQEALAAHRPDRSGDLR
jgi:RNA polymerase sigma-70 factor (ECF subfamily)